MILTRNNIASQLKATKRNDCCEARLLIDDDYAYQNLDYLETE